MKEKDLPKCGFCALDGREQELVRNNDKGFLVCPKGDGENKEHPPYMMSLKYLNNSSKPQEKK